MESARKRGWVVKRFSAKDISSLELEFRSNSLFQAKTLFVLSDPDSLKPKELEWLSVSKSVDGTLVFFKEGVIGAKILNAIPDKKIEKSEFSKTIWKFMDSFYPKNSKVCISLFHETIANDPVEMVFVLLARHLRDLYYVLEDSDGFNGPPWRVKKLEVQANKFGAEKLKEIINELAEIDVEVKTTRKDLKDSLDLLILVQLH